MSNTQKFINACEKGNTEAIINLIALGVYPSLRDNLGIKTAAFNGNYDTFVYLSTLPEVDVLCEDLYCFKAACEKGYIDIVKYIYDNYDFDIRIDNSYVIKNTTSPDVLNFLISTDKFDLSTVGSHLLENATTPEIMSIVLSIPDIIIPENIIINVCKSLYMRSLCDTLDLFLRDNRVDIQNILDNTNGAFGNFKNYLENVILQIRQENIDEIMRV